MGFGVEGKEDVVGFSDGWSKLLVKGIRTGIAAGIVDDRSLNRKCRFQESSKMRRASDNLMNKK